MPVLQGRTTVHVSCAIGAVGAANGSRQAPGRQTHLNAVLIQRVGLMKVLRRCPRIDVRRCPVPRKGKIKGELQGEGLQGPGTNASQPFVCWVRQLRPADFQVRSPAAPCHPGTCSRTWCHAHQEDSGAAIGAVSSRVIVQ
jgi:hypothetical protein